MYLVIWSGEYPNQNQPQQIIKTHINSFGNKIDMAYGQLILKVYIQLWMAKTGTNF